MFFFSISENKKFSWNIPGQFESWKGNAKPGQYYFREPVTASDNRTTAQNRLYWKRNLELSEITGDTPEDIHSYIMHECGFTKEINFEGKITEIRISSTILNTVEFSKLFEKQESIARFIDPEIKLTRMD